MISRFARLAAAAVFIALLPSITLAQRFWDTPAGGQQVGGAVALCLNGSSQAVPCSASVPLQTAGGGGGGGGDATAANQVTGNASLSVMDDWDDGDNSATVVNKPSATATYAITPVVSTAAESGHILKASAGNLYGLSVTTGASAGYVMIFNATSAPADGAVTPTHCYSVPATSSLGASWPIPAAFSTGITVVFSTTGCFTKTASATAFISGSVK